MVQSYRPCGPVLGACQPSNHREESNKNQQTYRHQETLRWQHYRAHALLLHPFTQKLLASWMLQAPLISQAVCSLVA